MERMCPNTKGDFDGEMVEAENTTAWYMETEMRFSRSEFAKAFSEKISEEAKKRLWAYYTSKSKADAVRLIGLSGSVKQFSSSLLAISRRMGASSVRDLFAKEMLSEGTCLEVALIEDQSRVIDINGRFLESLIQKQGYKCALSGEPLEPNIAELDHITPHDAGGRHECGNVQWVHQEVNRMKGQMAQERFVYWCVAVARYFGG